MSNPHITLYIGTGMKNGYYTLRRCIQTDRRYTDNYVKNLSTDRDKAVAKALEYSNSVYKDHPQVTCMTDVDFELSPHGTAITHPADIERLRMIDAGVMPFGKHIGTAFTDLEDGYVLWWADREAELTVGDPKNIAIAVCHRCKDECVDRGLFLARELKVIAAEINRAKSRHVGTIGERNSYNVTITASNRYEGTYGSYYITAMIDSDYNLYVYRGSSNLGPKGIDISIRATIKEHTEYKGALQTRLLRPMRLG